MGSRRAATRDTERKEVFAPPARATKTVDAPGPQSVSQRMFSLQRDYGNAAVANVVQRRERPQSTDAPKTGPPPKKPPSPKAAPPPEDFAPTSANPKYGDWTDEALSTRAGNELDSTVKNSWSWAAELYEELWFRHKTRALATGPWRAYKKIGDAKREKFWEGVMLGAIKPGEKQPESQAGKEF